MPYAIKVLLIIFGCVGAYALVASIIWCYAYRASANYQNEADRIGVSTIAAIFWPVGGPVCLGLGIMKPRSSNPIPKATVVK